MELTGEKRWEKKVIEEDKREDKTEEEKINKSEKSEGEKKKGRSGVGYTTGSGTVWNVAKYMTDK